MNIGSRWEEMKQHSSKSSTPHASFGWCSQCNVEHRLEQGNAHRHALELMKELEELKRIDYRRDSTDADPRFSTDYLFGKACGKMFGVLECEDGGGKVVVLRAFSCQYNAAWNLDGWVSPLFDVEDYEKIMVPGDRRIKEFGREIDALNSGDEDLPVLKRQRKHLSRSIMMELHKLYELMNFRGEKMPLTEVFKIANGIPTGAGDCCAPKLLNHAARHNLRPLGIAEFYWGKTNPSGTREHGRFYSSCIDNCLPILGFMLCGAGP